MRLDAGADPVGADDGGASRLAIAGDDVAADRTGSPGTLHNFYFDV